MTAKLNNMSSYEIFTIIHDCIDELDKRGEFSPFNADKNIVKEIHERIAIAVMQGKLSLNDARTILGKEPIESSGFIEFLVKA